MEIEARTSSVDLSINDLSLEDYITWASQCEEQHKTNKEHEEDPDLQISLIFV